MEIEFDPAKWAWTLRGRKLDFRDALRVFAGRRITQEDTRKDYGERRYVTFGMLEGVYVAVAWTRRYRGEAEVRRIFSMRRINEREIRAHLQRLERGDEDPR